MSNGKIAVAVLGALAVVILPPLLFSGLPDSYRTTAASTVAALAIIVYTGLVARSITQARAFRQRDKIQQYRSLQLLSDQLLVQLKSLPETPTDFREVQKLGVWNERDVSRLSMAAPMAGKEAWTTAAEVIEGMRWLGSRIRNVQVADTGQAKEAFHHIVESHWSNYQNDYIDGLEAIKEAAAEEEELLSVY